jgi:hypothetical protein
LPDPFVLGACWEDVVEVELDVVLALEDDDKDDEEDEGMLVVVVLEVLEVVEGEVQVSVSLNT